LTAAAPLRDLRFGPREVTVERASGGVIYVRPVHPLGEYPRSLTDKLEYWAAKTPDKVLFGQRDSRGQWRTLTYAQFRSAARRVAQALLDRPHVSVQRPIAILSGNSLEHAVLGFAAYYAGIPYAPISTAYSLVSSDFGKLRHIFQLLTPGMVYASDPVAYRKAIDAVLPADAELADFAQLDATAETPAVEEARAAVTPDTIAKLLFTSGSTGAPKGVINTHRMLASNQQLVRNILRWVEDEPPVLCDWLPWNHTFGGNHDVGLVVYNGGSFYIDEGRPAPAGMAATVRNIYDVRPNLYLNVPKGFEALLPFLRGNREFRERFFGSVKMLYYAGAGLSQPVWEELQELAVKTCGERILMFTGLGSTETGPAAMFPGKDLQRAGEIGLPAAGVELKLVPRGDKLEARLKGPGITPGYWRQHDLTRAAFDEEGFYCIGDAFRFADPDDINRGFVFDGRIVEDFKLSTGTFVSTGPLRARFLAHFAPYAQDVVIAGHDRDFVTALVFPAADVCSQLPPEERRGTFQSLLNEFAAHATGSSNRIVRIVLLEEPPSIDRHEITDKGSINQGAVLRNRAALVEDLYAEHPPLHVISLRKEIAK
jgi:feruloyl-CoA synthase